ncbi:MAG: phage tail tape measure protein [Phycisphaerales bacterium]
MATSFDATARINLDIRAFAQGAQAVTKSGGQMEKVFSNLNSVLSKVALIEGGLAAKLRTSLGVYNSISTATKNYASAVQALQKNEANSANGAKLMTQAFQQLRAALAQVQGLSEKEYARLSRTVALYEKLANVVRTLASAQKNMSSITQNAAAAQQKEEQAKRKAAETSQRLSIEEQKLAIQREKLAQSAQRIAQQEQAMANSRARLAQATQNANSATVSFSGSTFALRNTVGELESAFQALFNTLVKIPTALASAAISQEAAFAQVERVVGKAESASVGLLERFQEIAQQAPISFEEVARIGQLGAAIGISSENLGDFTDTIVKFSLTTGVASEEATILLGRIAQMENVPISEIDQLGSAILALGTASAATDQEILRVNASIATVSNLFGLTAQQTAGLSAALATLQVRPELSRGALTRVFNELSTAVSEGGTELSKLAKVMGLTDAEVLKLYNNPATRGDFLLAFIQGLSRAAGAGGDVQGVLRALGVNAVRDIDVFSRLANNFDVVSESFDRANVQFARGTELNRQSKGIYETTSAEIQNLSDAFKTLLATLGGPLATAVGEVASNLANMIGFLAHLGPVVPIVGTLTAVAIAGGAAWALYQLALSKTIQSLIATRELQARLGVTTLNAKTAIDVYRGSLLGASQATGAAAQGTNAYTAATGRLAVATQTATASYRANLVTNQQAAVAAAQAVAATNAQARAVSGALPGFRAYAIATDFAAQSTQRNTAAQIAAVPTSRALANAAALAAVPLSQQATATAENTAAQTAFRAGTFASAASMQQYAAAANTAVFAQRGLATQTATTNAAITAGAATTARATTAIAGTGLAARAAAFAFGPWGLAISTAAILLGPLIGQMFDFRSESEKIAAAAFEASGGTTALANAIKADTDAAIKAAGSVGAYNKAVQDGSASALSAIGVYRTVTVQKSDLADQDVRSAEAARTEAKERLRAIEATKGSKSALEAQAKGHGVGAQAAQRYLREIAKEEGIVREATAALGENTAAIGENTKQWLLDTAQAALETSRLADGSKISSDAMDQLAASGVNVGDVLKLSLSDPQAALKQLDAAIKTVSATADNYSLDVNSDYSKQLISDAAAAGRLKDFLEALRTTVAAEDDATTKSAISKQLLADALDSSGQSAQSASGKIKLTKEALEDLDTTGEEAQQAIDQLAQNFEKFGTPFDAFKTAAESAFKGASDAVDKFSLKSKGGLDAYIKELEKIAKAQRDWSANLIKIAATLGPDVAEQFRKLGPEAAPAVAELANLSVKELEKLGPRLREIGADATSNLAAAIIQNSGKIENATLQTKTIIADVFGNLIDKAKTSEDFATVSNQYAALVTKFSQLKGVKIDISADDAKAFKSLNDLSLYLDLVGQKKVKPEIAIDIIKAQGDITKLQELLKNANLNKEGKATLNTLLFQAQLTQLTTFVDGLEAEGKLDAKGKGKLSDEEYRAKVLALTQFLASSEGQGLLNPKGKAQLNDKDYRAQMQALANAILGKEQAGEFDVNGDGKLDDDEFKALLEALKRAVADANRGKLNPKGTVTLAGVGNFNRQLGGIVQAAYSAGSRITNALTRSATVSVGYYYYQKNSPPKSYAAANGGWINGPGGPKSDVIPAMLSNGEFVVNAASAKRFGALLEIINRSGGRGFGGVAKRLLDTGVTGGAKQVRARQGGAGTTMLGGNSAVQQVPPESVSVFAARLALPSQGPTNVFNINNQYPQAEPTSTTINRSLAYAATISGV